MPALSEKRVQWAWSSEMRSSGTAEGSNTAPARRVKAFNDFEKLPSRNRPPARTLNVSRIALGSVNEPSSLSPSSLTTRTL